jgi:hypothetical protein
MPSGVTLTRISPDPFRLRLPLKTVLFCQRQAAIAIAGGDNHIAETGIAKGGDDRFPHAAAALNHHAGWVSSWWLSIRLFTAI